MSNATVAVEVSPVTWREAWQRARSSLKAFCWGCELQVLQAIAHLTEQEPFATVETVQARLRESGLWVMKRQIGRHLIALAGRRGPTLPPLIEMYVCCPGGCEEDCLDDSPPAYVLNALGRRRVQSMEKSA